MKGVERSSGLIEPAVQTTVYYYHFMVLVIA